MQYLYAFETTQQLPASHCINHLEKSILSVKDQYLYILLTIREVANFVEKDAKIKASKHIKNDSDKNFNTKLLNNVIIQYLNNDKEFELEIKNAKIASLLDEDDIRRLYKIFTETKEYSEYLNNGTEFNVEEDKAIISFLLNNIIIEDEIFATNIEELFTNWQDDAEYVVEAVQEVIQKSKNELKLHLEKGNLKDKFKELTQFGIDLFNETVNHKKEHQQLIEPKLKNWEADRLAVIDVILIRMAVSEFLYFPSIPVKVTINEYLDIAKEYSTPKSKDFINGVLDSLMRDMKKNEQIHKTGRGLL
ncbi:MAG: transcription antitermination factor NusB [Chitinophagales bacterium]